MNWSRKKVDLENIIIMIWRKLLFLMGFCTNLIESCLTVDGGIVGVAHQWYVPFGRYFNSSVTNILI